MDNHNNEISILWATMLIKLIRFEIRKKGSLKLNRNVI